MPRTMNHRMTIIAILSEGNGGDSDDFTIEDVKAKLESTGCNDECAGRVFRVEDIWDITTSAH